MHFFPLQIVKIKWIYKYVQDFLYICSSWQTYSMFCRPETVLKWSLCHENKHKLPHTISYMHARLSSGHKKLTQFRGGWGELRRQFCRRLSAASAIDYIFVSTRMCILGNFLRHISYSALSISQDAYLHLTVGARFARRINDNFRSCNKVVHLLWIVADRELDRRLVGFHIIVRAFFLFRPATKGKISKKCDKWMVNIFSIICFSIIC